MKIPMRAEYGVWLPLAMMANPNGGNSMMPRAAYIQFDRLRVGRRTIWYTLFIGCEEVNALL